MSIAVSALVRPSRILRFLTVSAGLAQLAAGLAVVLGAPGSYLGAPLCAALPALAGSALLACAACRPKRHRIDISGTGELRVTVQQGVGAPGPGAVPAAMLLPGSVVWPLLMVLRCRVPAAETTVPARTLVVHVWRDGVDAGSWRSLAVALAVAGQRAGGTVGKDTMNSFQRAND